jgi:hypothetical protein
MRRYLPKRMLACLSAIAVTLPNWAFAQVAGGGGALSGGSAGLLQTAITWFTTNILGGMIMIGVLCIGGMFMFMRLYIPGVVMMIVGALVADNYTTIAAMF